MLDIDSETLGLRTNLIHLPMSQKAFKSLLFTYLLSIAAYDLPSIPMPITSVSQVKKDLLKYILLGDLKNK